MRPSVSVIVPVYNVEPFLAECLDSILNQTLREIEVIAVDDGSTDGSLDILNDYASRDPRLTVLTQRNLGAGAARNAGIRHAKGEYLFFFDADDFCARDMLRDFYEVAERDDADLVVSPRIIWDHQTRAVVQDKPIPRNILALKMPFDGRTIQGQAFTVFGPQPWNKFVRREMVISSGYWYQCIPRNNDVYFSCMSIALAKRISAISEGGYYHRVAHGGNLQADNDSSPFAVFEAYGQLRTSLQERGLFDFYSASYCRAFFSSLDYILRMLKEGKNIAEFFRRMKVVLVGLQLEIGLKDDEIAGKAKLRTWNNLKMSQESGEFLQRELRDANEDVKTARAECQKSQKECEDFHRTVDFAVTSENRLLRCCFICDNGYIIPTIVAISSLLENKLRSTICDIYVIAADLTEENEEIFRKFSAKDVRVTVVRASAEKLAGLHHADARSMCVATPAALLKFSLGDLLPSLDKILYLDGDILVRGDLLGLYRTDVKDVVLAAVKDSGAVYFKQDIHSRVANYFNSGVLLLNLKKMRDEKYSERLIEAKRQSTDASLMDQNVFNLVCDGKIKLLPMRYNCLALNLIRAYSRGNFSMTALNSYFGASYPSVVDAIDDAVIVHFASKDKPWKFNNVPFAAEWMASCKLAPYCPSQILREKLNAAWLKVDWRKAALAERNEPLSRLKIDLAKRDKTISVLKRDLAFYLSETKALKASTAYRVGMFVTWPARKAWRGVKCLRENGVKYTAKHIVGKVLRAVGSKCSW